MVERVLGEVGFAADPVHDLNLEAVATAGLDRAAQRVEDEGEVLERFPVEAETVERAQHERGVADPRVAVVPVPFAAGGFRERRGAGGHDRPGGRVAQALQRERAALDVRAPPVVREGCGAQPVPPEASGRHAALARFFDGGGGVPAPRERDERRLAFVQHRASVGATPPVPSRTLLASAATGLRA